LPLAHARALRRWRWPSTVPHARPVRPTPGCRLPYDRRSSRTARTHRPPRRAHAPCLADKNTGLARAWARRDRIGGHLLGTTTRPPQHVVVRAGRGRRGPPLHGRGVVVTAQIDLISSARDFSSSGRSVPVSRPVRCGEEETTTPTRGIHCPVPRKQAGQGRIHTYKTTFACTYPPASDQVSLQFPHRSTASCRYIYVHVLMWYVEMASIPVSDVPVRYVRILMKLR